MKSKKNLLIFLYFSAVLITAGSAAGVGNYHQSAEMFLPSSNTTCALPDLPEARGYHSQAGGLACGGGYWTPDDAPNSCDRWTAGTWIRTSHTLRKKRGYHESWFTADGVYLIGGIYSGSGRTSELIKEDGSVEEGFRQKYWIT